MLEMLFHYKTKNQNWKPEEELTNEIKSEHTLKLSWLRREFLHFSKFGGRSMSKKFEFKWGCKHKLSLLSDHQNYNELMK